jgi:uncharacterized protein
LLTSDLIRATKRAGKLKPRYLAAKDRERLLPAATSLIETYKAMVGQSKSELDEAAQAIPYSARDRPVVAGLRKLCDDRTELEQAGDHDPEEVRRVVFGISAAHHRAAVLAEAAALLGIDAETIDRCLFCDLREAQAVKAFDAMRPSDLLDRYNVSLAQAVLLRATKLTLAFEDDRPLVVRGVFRAARFFGLLHRIEKRKKGGFVVTFDGPFSLFDRVQKYGINLGMFLPTALTLQKFEIRADISWGPERESLELVLTPDDGLVSPREPPLYVRPEVEQLTAAFKALDCDWTVRSSDKIILSKDKAVIVPDLSFANRATGEEVYLEVFGFWSRDAVFRRVEQIAAGLPARLVLCVGKNARVSEEILSEEEGGSSLYVYKSAISAKEVLRRLDGRPT